jgi:nucleoid-associated protein YgaU
MLPHRPASPRPARSIAAPFAARPAGRARPLIAPIVFLAALIAVLSIAVDSGLVGGKEAGKTPTVTPTGKRTTKARATPVVKVRKFYRVKAGDTLSVIAEKFNTTENELMIVNDLTTTTLRVGQRLKLPSPSP